MEDTFLEIKWCREDIEKLLKEHGKDSSERSIDKFLKEIDIKYFEGMCIQTGWEMLRSMI